MGAANSSISLSLLIQKMKLNDGSLQKCMLGGRGLEHKDLTELGEALETNSTVVELHLQSNGIDDLGLQTVARAFAQPGLMVSILSLWDNAISDLGIIALADALKTNTKVHTLNLNANRIGDAGAQALATLLSSNAHLTTLHLAENQIHDAGVVAITKALSANVTLTYLDLGKNPFSPKVGAALIATLEINFRLSTVNLEDTAIPHSQLVQIRTLLRTDLRKVRFQAYQKRKKPSIRPEPASSSSIPSPSSNPSIIPTLPDQTARIPAAGQPNIFQIDTELDVAVRQHPEMPSLKVQPVEGAVRLSETRSLDFLSRQLITTLDDLEIESGSFAEGASGKLHRGKFHGKQVAVKRLKYSSPDMSELIKELRMWSQLTHANIVQLMGFTEPPLEPMIVMELMDCSLFDVLRNKDASLTLLRRLEIAHELASGVSYLHAQQGVHRDIKSLNVLVRGNDIKLADFGATRGLNTMSVTMAGSIRWNAPEVHDGAEATPASDVYAMGITFSEILTRQIPYAHLQADGAVIKAVLAGSRPQLWPPTEGMQELTNDHDLEQQTDGFLRLIQRCWEEAPEHRPVARQVRLELADLLHHLRHPASTSTIPTPSSSVKSIPLPIYSFSNIEEN